MCKMPQTIRVAGMENDSITNGPGLRFVLFVQGCPFRCEGCHNPQAQPFEGGTEMTVEEVFAKITGNPLLTGVTFSGGEPFAQAAQLLPLAQKIKQAGLELGCYTGYTFEQLTEDPREGVMELLSCLDVLVDGPFEPDNKDYDIGFRGSKNQRFLDVKQSLSQQRAVPDQSGRWET